MVVRGRVDTVSERPASAGAGELAGTAIATDVDAALRTLCSVPGVTGAAFVDVGSGGVVCAAGNVPGGIERIATAAAMAVRAGAQIMDGLGAVDQAEDVLVNFPSQVHVARVVPLPNGQRLMAYAVIDRAQSLPLFTVRVREIADSICC